MKSTNLENFNKDVIESNKIVLLDVWASFCAPCRGMEPILELLSKEYKDIEIVKLDAGSEMQLVQELGVTGLPTFIVFKDGKAVNKRTGACNKNVLLDLLRI